MAKNYTKLRLSKKLKHQRKTVANAGAVAGQTFDKHVVARWRNLRHVRRFVFGWLILVALLTLGIYMQTRSLGGHYLVDKPVEGGTFREGVMGNISNINPIFATSLADSSASKLLFSSILKYDANNKLVGDLAEKYSVNADGTVYTVKLRSDVLWHDGYQFNADDVLFTYNVITHPDTRSHLNSSWQGIEIKKVDDHTVTFTLPNPFAPFPHSLTRGGILPEHILSSVDPVQLRAHPFNTDAPVGTGPFTFDDLIIEEDLSTELRLEKNNDYFSGAPAVDKFILISYDDREELLDDYEEGDLTAAAGVQSSEYSLLEESLRDHWKSLQLNSGVYAFMRNGNPILKDAKVRRALTLASDRNALAEQLTNISETIRGPLIDDQLSLKDFPLQPGFNLESAKKLLNEAGWKKKADGLRYKGDKLLSLQLITQSSDNYPQAALILKEQWYRLGVDLQVTVVEETAIQDTYIVPHNYDVLLFGIALGSDPDVYGFWHSSQAGIGGFNLSEYKNSEVDTALEGGRTRLDKELRRAKYLTFQKRWMKDYPAVALYRPTFAYLLRGNVSGFEREEINNPKDRYSNVHQWKIVEEKVERYQSAF